MKKILAIVLALAMVAALAACGNNGGTTTTTAEPTTGGSETQATEATQATTASPLTDNTDAEETDARYPEVNVINKDEVLTLFPWVSKTPACLCEVYEKMYDYDDYSGDVKPILADASYDGNFLPGCDHEAGTGDYTVHIWNDIYDHAGNHMTSADIKFSWDYVVENVPSNKGARAVYEGCEIVDDYTVIFHFGKELNGLREFDDCFADFFIMTEAGFNSSATELVKDEAGTGPYKLVSFESGSVFSIEADDDYWAKDHDIKAKTQWQNVQVINYLTLDDKAQQVTALQTGKVDAIQDIAVDYLPMFQDGGQYSENFNVISYMQAGEISICPNNNPEMSLMSNQDLRLALFYATSPELFVAAMGGETYGVVTHSLFGAGQADALAKWETLDNYQNVYDVEKAKEYMTKAGYNGEELRFITQQSLGDAGELLQNMWTEAGFNVKLNVLDTNTYNDEKEAGNFDIQMQNSAGYCGAVQASRAFAKNNKSGYGLADWTDNQEWFDLLTTINTLEGHTEENVDAWMTICFDNAYDMGLATTWINNVVNKDITSICRDGKNSFIPGGFTYNVG